MSKAIENVIDSISRRINVLEKELDRCEGAVNRSYLKVRIYELNIALEYIQTAKEEDE